MRLPRFSHLRIAFLLGCLTVVGVVSAMQHVQSRGWQETLQVIVYPLNGDGSAASAAYIATLDSDQFASIDRWGIREARRHGLPLEQPFKVELGATIDTLPPAFPLEPSAVSVISWNLRFRYWAWRNTPDGPAACRSVSCIRLFTVYHQGEDGKALAHSVGMQKGLMGLINAFARPAQSGQNNIVIAHELLHTLGASDKYARDSQPVFPEGYADPDGTPRYPQRNAEIMAGRRALAPTRSVMPNSLGEVRINDYTAMEINWFKAILAN